MGHSSRDLVDEPPKSSENPTNNKSHSQIPQRFPTPVNYYRGGDQNSASLTKTNPDNLSDQFQYPAQKDMALESNELQTTDQNEMHDTKSNMTDNLLSQTNDQDQKPAKIIASSQNMQSGFGTPENLDIPSQEASVSFRGKSPKYGNLTPRRGETSPKGSDVTPTRGDATPRNNAFKENQSSNQNQNTVQHQTLMQGLNPIDENQQGGGNFDSGDMAQFMQGENTMNALWQYQIEKELDNRQDQLTTINEENSLGSSRVGGKLAHTKSRNQTNSVSDSPSKNHLGPPNHLHQQNSLQGQIQGTSNQGGQGILSLGANALNDPNYKQLRVSFDDKQSGNQTRRDSLTARGIAGGGLRRENSDEFAKQEQGQQQANNPIYRGQSLDSYQQKYGDSKKYSHSGDMGERKSLRRSISHEEGSSFQPQSPRNRPEDMLTQQQQSPSKLFHKKDHQNKDKDKKNKKNKQHINQLDHTSSTSHYPSDNEHFNNHGLNVIRQSFNKESQRNKATTSRNNGQQHNDELDLVHHSSDKKHIYGPYNKDAVMVGNTNMIKTKSGQNLKGLEYQHNSSQGSKQYRKNSSIDSEYQLHITEQDRQIVKNAPRNSSLQRNRSNNSVEWQDLQQGSSMSEHDKVLRKQLNELNKESTNQRKESSNRPQENRQGTKNLEMYEAPIKIQLSKKPSRNKSQDEATMKLKQEQKTSFQEDNQFYDVSTGKVNSSNNNNTQNDSKTLNDSKIQMSNASETYGLDFRSANQTPTQNSQGFEQLQKQSEPANQSLSDSLGLGTDLNFQTPSGSIKNTRSKGRSKTPTQPLQRYPSPQPFFNASFQRSTSLENHFQTPLSSQNDINLDSQNQGGKVQQGKLFSILNLREHDKEQGKSFFGKTTQLQQSISLTPREQKLLYQKQLDSIRSDQFEKSQKKAQKKEQQDKKQEQKLQLNGQSSSDGERTPNQQEQDNSDGGRNSKQPSSDTNNSQPIRPESKLELLEKQMQANPLLSQESKKSVLPTPPRPQSQNRLNSETGSRTTGTDLPSHFSRINDMFDKQQEQAKTIQGGGKENQYSTSPKKSGRKEKEVTQDELSWILKNEGKKQKFVSSQELKEKPQSEIGGGEKDLKPSPRNIRDVKSPTRFMDKVKFKGKGYNDLIEYQPTQRKEKTSPTNRNEPTQHLKDNSKLGSPFNEQQYQQIDKKNNEKNKTRSPSQRHLQASEKDPFAYEPSPKFDQDQKQSKNAREFMRSPRNSNLSEHERSLQSPFKQSSTKLDDQIQQSVTPKRRNTQQNPFASDGPGDTKQVNEQDKQSKSKTRKSPRRSPTQQRVTSPISPLSGGNVKNKEGYSPHSPAISPSRRQGLKNAFRQMQLNDTAQQFDTQSNSNSVNLSNHPRKRPEDNKFKGSYEKRSFKEYMQSPAFNSNSHNLKDRQSPDKNFGDSGVKQSNQYSGKDPTIEEISQSLKISPIRTRKSPDKRERKLEEPRASRTPRKSDRKGKVKTPRDRTPSPGNNGGQYQDQSNDMGSGRGGAPRSSGDTDKLGRPQSVSKCSSRPKFVLSEPLPFEDKLFKKEKQPSIGQVYKDKKYQEQISKQNLSKDSTDILNSMENSQQLTGRGTSHGRRSQAKNVQKSQKGQGGGALQTQNKIHKQKNGQKSSSRQGSVKKVDENGEIVIDLSKRFPQNNWYRQDSGSVQNSKDFHQNKHLQMYLTHQQQAAEEFSRSQMNSKNPSAAGSLNQELDAHRVGGMVSEEKPRAPPPVVGKNRDMDDDTDTLTSKAKKKQQRRPQLKKDNTLSTEQSIPSQQVKQKQSSQLLNSQDIDEDSDRLISNSRKKIRQLRKEGGPKEKLGKGSRSLNTPPPKEDDLSSKPTGNSLNIGNYDEASLRLPSAKQESKGISKQKKEIVEAIQEEEQESEKEPHTPQQKSGRSTRSPRSPRLSQDMGSGRMHVPQMNWKQHLAYLREQKEKEELEIKQNEQQSFSSRMKQKSQQFLELHSDEESITNLAEPVQATQIKSPRTPSRQGAFSRQENTSHQENASRQENSKPPTPPKNTSNSAEEIIEDKGPQEIQTRDIRLPPTNNSQENQEPEPVFYNQPQIANMERLGQEYYGGGDNQDSFGHGSLSLGGGRAALGNNMNNAESLGFSFAKGDSIQSMGLQPASDLLNPQFQNIKGAQKGGKIKKGDGKNLARGSMSSPRDPIRLGAQILNSIVIGDQPVNIRRQQTVSSDRSDTQRRYMHFNQNQDQNYADSEGMDRMDSLACPVCHQGYNVNDRVPKLVCARRGHSVCQQCAIRDIMEAGRNPVCPVCGTGIMHKGNFSTDHHILEKVNASTEVYNQDQVLPAFRLNPNQGLQNPMQNGNRNGKKFPNINMWQQGNLQGAQDPDDSINNNKFRNLQQQQPQFNPPLSPTDRGNPNANPWKNAPSPRQQSTQRDVPPLSPRQKQLNGDISRILKQLQEAVSFNETVEALKTLKNQLLNKDSSYNRHFVIQGGIGVLLEENLLLNKDQNIQEDVVECLALLGSGDNYVRQQIVQQISDIKIRQLLLLAYHNADYLERNLDFVIFLARPYDPNLNYANQEFCDTISRDTFKEIRRITMQYTGPIQKKFMQLILLLIPASRTFQREMLSQTSLTNSTILLEKENGDITSIVAYLMGYITNLGDQMHSLSIDKLSQCHPLQFNQLITTLMNKSNDPKQYRYQASFMYALQGLAQSSQDLQKKIATNQNIQAILVSAYQNRKPHAQAQAISLISTLLTGNPEIQRFSL